MSAGGPARRARPVGPAARGAGESLAALGDRDPLPGARPRGAPRAERSSTTASWSGSTTATRRGSEALACGTELAGARAGDDRRAQLGQPRPARRRGPAADRARARRRRAAARDADAGTWPITQADLGADRASTRTSRRSSVLDASSRRSRGRRLAGRDGDVRRVPDLRRRAPRRTRRRRGRPPDDRRDRRCRQISRSTSPPSSGSSTTRSASARRSTTLAAPAVRSSRATSSRATWAGGMMVETRGRHRLHARRPRRRAGRPACRRGGARALRVLALPWDGRSALALARRPDADEERRALAARGGRHGARLRAAAAAGDRAAHARPLAGASEDEVETLGASVDAAGGYAGAAGARAVAGGARRRRCAGGGAAPRRASRWPRRWSSRTAAGPRARRRGRSRNCVRPARDRGGRSARGQTR